MSEPLLKSFPDTKRQKRMRDEVCIICRKECHENKFDYPAHLWSQLKDVSLEWKGLDRHGDLHDKINWDDGTTRGPSFIRFAKWNFQFSESLNKLGSGQKRYTWQLRS